MQRCFAFVAAFLVIAAYTSAASDQQTRIRKLATERVTAFTSENYTRLAELTYPKFYKMCGGRDKTIGSLRSDREYLKENGGVTIAGEVGEPGQIVTVGDKQFAIVPVIVRIQVPEGTSRSKIFFIAISEDRGNTWTFINSSALHDAAPGKEEETLKQLIPSFPAQLSLPSWKPQVLQSKMRPNIRRSE